MNKNKFSKFDWNYLIVAAGLLAYAPLIKSYFVLDEWLTFLNYFEFSKRNFLEIVIHFLSPQSGQYLPLTQIFAFTIFTFSKLNYYSYFFAGMFLHFVVAITLYNLLVLITKDKKAALVGSLFFVSSPQHFQGVSWVIANLGYFLSSFFLLLSLKHFYLWLYQRGNNLLANQIFSSVYLFLSLLSKDVGLFFVILLPILALTLTKKNSKMINTFFILFPTLLLTGWKYLTIKSNPQVDFDVLPQAGILNVITLPFRALTQSLVPQDIIYKIAKLFLVVISPPSIYQIKTTLFNQRVESIGALISVIFIACLILYVGKLIYLKNRKIFESYIIGIAVASLSGLSYFFVDSKVFSLLAPRYTYFGVLGISISIAAFLVVRWRYKKMVHWLMFLYMIFLFVSTFRMSIVIAKDNILRKNILESVNSKIPNQNTNLVLLIESDKSYYGLPDDTKTVPFQASPAIVFAAYLHDKVYLPSMVYKYETFQKIDSQGYYYDSNGGYGYYWNINNLKNDVLKFNLKREYVYSFKYNSSLDEIIDQTEEVRHKLFR